jgi:hypothetical protein
VRVMFMSHRRSLQSGSQLPLRSGAKTGLITKNYMP